MINFKLIYKILGSLLFLESLFMLICLVISLSYQEDDVFSFIISILVTQMGAYILRYLGRDANNNMSRKDSFLVVTLTWAVYSLFGTLPYMVGGYITDFKRMMWSICRMAYCSGVPSRSGLERWE